MRSGITALAICSLSIVFPQTGSLAVDQGSLDGNHEEQQTAPTEAAPWSIGEQVICETGELTVLREQQPETRIKVSANRCFVITAVGPNRVRVIGSTDGTGQLHEWVRPAGLTRPDQDPADTPKAIREEMVRLNHKARDLFDSRQADLEVSPLGQEIDSAVEALCIRKKAYVLSTRGFWTPAEEEALQREADQIREGQYCLHTWQQLSTPEKLQIIEGGLFTPETLQAFLEISPLDDLKDEEAVAPTELVSP